MKRLLPLLLFSFAFSASAQNYELFPNPSDTLTFENTNGNLVFIAFDSISSGNTYWPQSETHPDFSGSYNQGCNGHLFDTAWCGYQVKAISASKYAFHHTFYDLEIDLSYRNVNADSIGWLKGPTQNSTIYSAFSGKTRQTLYNNQVDSVLTFHLTVLDSNGNPVFNSVNVPLKFVVSKNNGLITIPLFYLSDQHAQPKYSASRSFTRADFQLLTKADIYNFNIGDQFHYYHGTYYIDQPANRTRTYSNLSIIGKSHLNPDSVVYTVNRTYTKFELNTQSTPYYMEEVIYHDTINLEYGQLNTLFSSEFTFQSDTTPTVNFHGYKTSYWLSDNFQTPLDTQLKRSGIFTSGNWFPTNGNCIMTPFEPSPTEALYLKGLGRVKYYQVNFPQVYEESLLYFKGSNGQTWGTPYHIGMKELALKTQLKLYPNPASDVLNIELPDGIQQLQVTVFDQLGRILIKQSINNENHSMAVSALSPGTYFIKTDSGQAIPFVKQ